MRITASSSSGEASADAERRAARRRGARGAGGVASSSSDAMVDGREHEPEPERRLLRARLRPVPGDRQVDRCDEVLAGAVVVDAVADRQALRALGDQREDRPRGRGPGSPAASTADSRTPSIAVVSSGRACRAISARQLGRADRGLSSRIVLDSSRAGMYIRTFDEGVFTARCTDRAGSCNDATVLFSRPAARWVWLEPVHARSTQPKIAVVTGASSGIGQAAALQIAERGAGVILTYNANPDGAKDTVAADRGRRGRGRRASPRRRRQRVFAAFARQVADELHDAGGATRSTTWSTTPASAQMAHVRRHHRGALRPAPPRAPQGPLLPDPDAAAAARRRRRDRQHHQQLGAAHRTDARLLRLRHHEGRPGRAHPLPGQGARHPRDPRERASLPGRPAPGSPTTRSSTTPRSSRRSSRRPRSAASASPTTSARSSPPSCPRTSAGSPARTSKPPAASGCEDTGHDRQRRIPRQHDRTAREGWNPSAARSSSSDR